MALIKVLGAKDKPESHYKCNSKLERSFPSTLETAEISDGHLKKPKVEVRHLQSVKNIIMFKYLSIK
jgi:hypothetical protein